MQCSVDNVILAERTCLVGTTGGHMAAQRFQTPFPQLHLSFDVVDVITGLCAIVKIFDEGSGFFDCQGQNVLIVSANPVHHVQLNLIMPFYLAVLALI